MSLPTLSGPGSKPSQPSIRSFFQARSPSYAPPPGQPSSKSPSSSAPTGSAPHAPPLPPHAADASRSQLQQQDQSRRRQQLEQATASLPMPSVDAPIPPVPAAANLPSESSIRPIADSDVQALRRINALLLPVSYSDSFYARAVDPAASARFSRVITWQHQGQEPKVVGGLVCRLEPLVDGPYASTGRDAALSSPPQGLYIQSLCLLSPYRGLGLINAAVDNIVATAVADPKLDVRVLTAHVWTENEDGLRWYDGRRFKRQGQPISGYYLKLRPDSAWLVQRPIAAFVRSSLPSPASAGSTPNNISNNGISGMASPRPPLMSPHGQSFQNQRAETEWNDLPADMAPTMLAPPKKVNSEPGFTASSRSSSTVRRKKDRSYPAAAFGS